MSCLGIFEARSNDICRLPLTPCHRKPIFTDLLVLNHLYTQPGQTKRGIYPRPNQALIPHLSCTNWAIIVARPRQSDMLGMGHSCACFACDASSFACNARTRTRHVSAPNVSHRGAISRHSGDMRPGGWAEVRPVWGSAAFRAH